ncbi:MAG TPA: glycosyltransferase family 1 protein [Allosphingosinicella sp.]
MTRSIDHDGQGDAPRKRILIDASPVTSSVDGLSVYIVNLIRNLPADALAEFDFTILLNPGIDWPELTEAIRSGGMEDLRVPIAPIGPHRDWDMFRFLRRHRSRFDLIHITSHNYPIALEGGVVTIHDVTFKTWFDSKSRIPGWRFAARSYLDRIVRRALKRAQAVIAVSDSTRRELVERFAPADPGRIETIHEGWEHLADYDPAECEPFDFGAGGYLFFLGSYRVHKNLSLLLEAFRIAMDRIPEDRILVISGSSGRLSAANREVMAAINAKRTRVIFTGYVSNACVARLYREADAFIFPSLSEGFGLPVLEAFHFGAPLLASRATSLPEVAGDAALYFDPNDAGDMADAMVRFYADPELGPRLAAAGMERLDSFSWKKAAEETVAVYRKCLSSSR